MILLDSHALLWWLRGSGLGPEADAILRSDAVICVSTATAWELGIKAAAGRLRLSVGDLPTILEEEDFDVLPITVHHAMAAAALPLHHGDPFDRMLVAQARLEGLRLMTADRAMADYDVEIVPARR